MRWRRRKVYSKLTQEEEEEGLFRADAVNEEDPERDRATQEEEEEEEEGLFKADARRRRRKRRKVHRGSGEVDSHPELDVYSDLATFPVNIFRKVDHTLNLVNKTFAQSNFSASHAGL